jgi:DDB1- and CUL4-associated factor 7
MSADSANLIPPKVSSPGNLSPTSSKQTASNPPPLLRIAASPHDAHLLGTFSQDSSLIRILDVRQPGQALLELRGHSAPVNCIEWSQSRRGMLASGADDSLVLVWDLLSQANSTVTPGQSNNAHAGGVGSERGPTAAWQCEYEVANVSWAPQGGMSGHGGSDWLSVVGGRGLWGVSM